MFFRHPFHHQDGSSSETWMGIIDGIYAIAATLIAIELPELFKSLLEAPVSSFRGDALFLMLAYEVTAYAATFLLLYELWLMHRTAIGLGGLKFQIQNICNALILAVTCLGAGNIILILDGKTDLAIEAIRDGATHQDLYKAWVGSHPVYGVSAFVLVALSFFLIAVIARTCSNYRQSAVIREIAVGSLIRGMCFLVFIATWLPLLFGQALPLLPPAVIVLIYLLVSFDPLSVFQASE